MYIWKDCGNGICCAKLGDVVIPEEDWSLTELNELEDLQYGDLNGIVQYKVYNNI